MTPHYEGPPAEPVAPGASSAAPSFSGPPSSAAPSLSGPSFSGPPVSAPAAPPAFAPFGPGVEDWSVRSGPPLAAPAPPAGPGVAPPFAAPPRDQDRRRLWWGLGIGAVVLVLACVGGVVGFGLLAAGSEDLVRSQAMSTVRSYLSDVKAADFSDAYDLLCDDVTAGLSESGFASRMRDNRLTDFTVHSASIDPQISVATTLRFADGTSHDQAYPLVQSSNGLKVCGGV